DHPRHPAPSAIRTASLEEARERISSLASSADGLAVVGVTGPVGSGKTTLARLLTNCIIATDDYLPDYDKVRFQERDLPEFADLPRLAADLSALRAGRTTQVPVWSFHSHKREGYRPIAPPREGLIVCEGIHALHDNVRDALDVRVFVEAARS